MIFCTNCGAQLSDDAAFCHMCGTKVETAETEAAPEEKAEVADAVQKESVSEDIQIAETISDDVPSVVTAEEAPQETVPRSTVTEETPQKSETQPIAVAETSQANYTQQQAQPGVAAQAQMPSTNPNAPRLQLATNRGLLKMIFLNLITLGIYGMVIWSRIADEINITASRYDGRKTMPYFAMCTIAPFTLFILFFVWIHNFCNRVGIEVRRRGYNYNFSAATFWLWDILGSLIIVGPFIFTYKLMKSMNKINASYNIYG